MNKFLFCSILILGSLIIYVFAQTNDLKEDGLFQNVEAEERSSQGATTNLISNPILSEEVYDDTAEEPVATRSSIHSYWGNDASSKSLLSKPSYITNIELSLREKMSLASTPVALVPEGAVVKVINSFHGEWWEVFYSGKTGYVLSLNLNYDEKNNQLPTATASNSNYWKTSDGYDSEPSFFTITKVDLKEHASAPSAIIVRIPKDTEVKAINSSLGEWKKVYFNGKTGYVLNKYLSDNKNNTAATDSAPGKPNYWASPEYYENKPSYFAKSTVYLREFMTSNSAIVTKLPKGAEVKLVNSNIGGWMEVYYEGKLGYVLNVSLSKNKSKPTEKKPTPPPPVISKPKKTPPIVSKPKKKGYYTVTQKTSFRKYPTSKAKVLLRFRPGDEVKVIDPSDHLWWKVIYKGQRGWVKKKLLDKN